MAEFSVRGFISSITCNKDRVKVVLNEYKKGYKTKGCVVADRNIKWSIHFPRYFIRFIPNNFAKGNLVEVKGEITQENRKYMIVGQTINLYSIVDISKELKLEKATQRANYDETPNIEEYFEKDF